MKNSFLIHYFLVNLRFFREISVCFENVPCKALYNGKKWGFEVVPRRCGVHSKPQPLLQKTCLSYTSETLATYVGM